MFLTVSGLYLGGVLDKIELLTVDLRYRILPGHGIEKKPPVTVVALDQNSIKEIGRWPIPRGYYTTILENIYRDGAKGVLMDMDFSSVGPDPEQDERLVLSVRQAGTVVLAAQMNERVTGEGVLIRNVSLPVSELKDAAMALGSITFEVDLDGVVRQMPPSINFGDENFRPLGAIGAAMIDPAASGISIPEGALVDVGSLKDPAFGVISFQRVLKGDFAKGLFSGNVVLIGATSADLHDFWVTPLGVTPGVFIQVAVLDTVLHRSWFLRQESLSTVIAIGFLSIVTSLVMVDRRWKKGALVLVCLICVIIFTAVLAAWSGYLLQVVPLLIIGPIIYPIQVALGAREVDLKLAQERRRMEAFLSIADLRLAEEKGQESYLVPLVLLGENLDLSMLQVYTLGSNSTGEVNVRRIIGEQENEPDPQLLDEVLKKGTCITQRCEGGGTVILIPLVTVRQTLGALHAQSRRNVDIEDADVRLLLSFATQTAYFLESLDLDLRVKDLYINTIRAISRALNSKDQFTSAHSELSLNHVEKFGRMCGLEREQIEALHIGALLHDIGKIGVPDSILVKNGRLSDDELEVIKTHPVIGSDIVRDLPFPDDVKMIILHHHERYDGTGYPAGLKKYEIPLLVRIFSILDVYEALVGSRPYRESLDPRGAADLIMEGSGTQFDPDLVDIFISVIDLPPWQEAQ